MIKFDTTRFAAAAVSNRNIGDQVLPGFAYIDPYGINLFVVGISGGGERRIHSNFITIYSGISKGNRAEVKAGCSVDGKGIKTA